MQQIRRVLVTRAPHQASALADALMERGFEVVSIPTIEIVAPADGYAAVDRALRRLEQFDWVVFTSANAVAVFGERHAFLEIALPETLQIAAIGGATSSALEEMGLRVDLLPERAVAELLVESLTPHVGDAAVLVMQAEETREVLVPGLITAGAKVSVAVAYRTVVAAESESLIRDASYDAVTFTSASSVRNFVALMKAAGVELPAATVVASIGPVTSEAVRAEGLAVAVESEEAGVVALAEALLRYERDRAMAR